MPPINKKNKQTSLRPLVSALCAEAAAVANAACSSSSCNPSLPPEQGSHHDNGGKGEAAMHASTQHDHHHQHQGGGLSSPSSSSIQHDHHQQQEGVSSTLVLDAAEAERYVLRVAGQSAGNASSMLKDVLQGRRTEVGICIYNF